MKKHLELVRKLLFKIETFPLKIKDGFDYDISIDGYSKEEINYNLLLMKEDNFIEGIFHRSVINKHLEVLYETLEITSNGHKYLASIKTENKADNEIGENKMILNKSYDEKNIWKLIQDEYDISKQVFGKKINFVESKFKREIIFRDVSHAFYLAKNGFNKPAVLLAGGVIEELLRIYLEKNHIKAEQEKFEKYIEACEKNGLLKSAISRLSDSVRHFRNLVHMQREKSNKYTLSKSTALGAVSTIFTLINDF